MNDINKYTNEVIDGIFHAHFKTELSDEECREDEKEESQDDIYMREAPYGDQVS